MAGLSVGEVAGKKFMLDMKQTFHYHEIKLIVSDI